MRLQGILGSVFILSFTLSAFGQSEFSDKTSAPYFFVENENTTVDSFPLLETNVDANVLGVLAEVKVRQIYRNDGAVPIHARYIFPGSTKAAVHGMTMRVGNRQVRAEIREKKAAQAEFDQAKSEGKTASLLSQERPNVFSMQLANILPKDVVEVELTYSELLVPEKSVYEWVFPTVVGPRYVGTSEAGSRSFRQPPFLRPGNESKPGKTPSLKLNVTVDAGLPLQNFESPSHQIQTEFRNPSHGRVRLSEESMADNRDFVLRYRLTQKELDSGLLLSTPTSTDGEQFFLLQVQPPKEVQVAKVAPRDFVFVVDVSGSMNGFPIDTAKMLFKKLSQGLRPVDTFNILFFSGGSRTLSEQSLPANEENIQRAISMLSSIEGGGETELLPALDHALQLSKGARTSRNIVVITDGYVQVEREAMQLIADNLGQANLFAMGIGSSINRHLIEGMARAGQGQPFFCLSPGDSDRVAEDFREYIEAPVLTKVRVEAIGFDVEDAEPRQFPDVMSQRPLMWMGKWNGPRQGKIVVSGQTANGSWSKTFSVADVQPSERHAALRFLWARERVARLSDFALHQLNDSEQAEVTQLGLRYQLLTEFTSFLAVLEEIRNVSGEAVDVEQPVSLPQGVSELAVGGSEMAHGDEPELMALVLALMAVAKGASLFRRRGHA